MRGLVAGLVSLAMIVSPLTAAAAPAGSVQGAVSLSGQPAIALELALVDVETGRVHRTMTNSAGEFSMDLAPGRYMLSGQGAGAVRGGSALLDVASGRVTMASLALEPVLQEDPGQPPAPYTNTQGGVSLAHDEVHCMIAGRYPIIDAQIGPDGLVKVAEVQFKSALGDEFYSVDMFLSEDGTLYVGTLPYPTVEASPITYYVQVNGEPMTPEVSAIVINEGDTCDGRLAAVALVGPGAMAGLGGGLAPLALVGLAAGSATVVTGVAVVTTRSASR